MSSSGLDSTSSSSLDSTGAGTGTGAGSMGSTGSTGAGSTGSRGSTGSTDTAGPATPARQSGDGGELQAAPPPRRRSFGSAADMVRSLVVVGVLVALILVLTPRTHEEQVREVPWAQTYGQAVITAGYPLYGPSPLPSGWRATSARTSQPAGTTLAWHVGFVTPKDRYVALEQRDGDGAAFVSDVTERGRLLGTVRIGGRTWQRLTSHSGDDSVRSLVLPAAASTVVVSGSGSFAELRSLAESLRAR